MECKNSGFIKNDGAELYFEEYGDGEPLLLLHGNGEDIQSMQNQILCFAEKFRVISMDSRWHGRSSRGENALSIAQMAKDAEALMNALNIDRYRVVGFSDGGNIAMQMALDEPYRLEAAVFCGANIQPNGLKAVYRLSIKTGHLVFSSKLKKAVKRQDKELIQSLERKKELMALMLAQPQIKLEQLQALNIKVMVIAGERDMIKDSHTKTIAGAIKGSKLVIVKGANHFLPMKYAKIFNREVMNFFESID